MSSYKNKKKKRLLGEDLINVQNKRWKTIYNNGLEYYYYCNYAIAN